MNTPTPFYKRKIFYIFIIIVAGGAGSFLLYGSDKEARIETEIVRTTKLIQIVSETGTVRSSKKADIAFEQSGKVYSVSVVNGSVVSAGEVLIQLDDSEQRANIQSARAQLRVEEANLASILNNASGASQPSSILSTTNKQQEVLVENAYSKLLSEGLVAEPEHSNFTQTPPIISGRYSGPEGTYKIDFSRGNQAQDYKMFIFGLETVRDVNLYKTSPSPIGTGGLYINLPDPLENYMETTWYVSIPNTKSSVYLANYNSYIASKEGAQVVNTQIVSTAETIKAQEAKIDQARAALAASEINLSKRTMRSPFDGIISDISINNGEHASAGSPVVSVISRNNYEITVDIPEDDIAFIDVGDKANVTFDAYNNELFQAVVTYVSPSARKSDGVNVFEVILQFTDKDPRIKAGLSVDVDIITETREGVIAVPSRTVIEENGKKLVRIMIDKNTYRNQIVTLGLRGEGGLIEVVSGLKQGDRLITFTEKDALASLNKIE